MSGDVQPRKRKDKKKKKDDLGVEEPRGTAAVLGEGDVFIHSYHEHGTGGHWCAKIIFFVLLAILLGLIGLIILENRGLSELEANAVESKYSGMLEGWLEDAPDDDHHDEHTLELKHHDDEDGDVHDPYHGHDSHGDDGHDDDQDEDEDEDDHELDDEHEDSLEEADEEEEGFSYRKYFGLGGDDEDETAEDQDEDEGFDEDEETEQDEERNLSQELDDEENSNENENYDENDDDDGENDDDDENGDNENDEDQDDDNEIDYNQDDENLSQEVDENANDDDNDEEEPSAELFDDENDQENEDEDDHDEDGEDDEDEELEVEKIEQEPSDEEPISIELPALREEDDADDQDDEKESADDNDDDDADNADPDDDDDDDNGDDADDDFSEVDDTPAVVERVTAPAGKPFVEVEEDDDSTERPPDTLEEEEEYEKQQEELRKEEEQSSHMWLKLTVGGALLVATHAVVRRATARDVPEREESSTREKTPVIDRRMTLIPEEPEPVIPKKAPHQTAKPPQKIVEEVKKVAPALKSAPKKQPSEEPEEIDEVIEDAKNDDEDKELYSDEELEDEEEMVQIENAKTAAVESEAPGKTESEDEEQDADDEDVPDDVEIIDDEQLEEELEEEEDISDVDDVELLNRLEAKYGRLPEPDRPGPKHKDGGNSIDSEWPGEPADAYWRQQVDTAEDELQQGEYSRAVERASANQLAGSARARYVIAAGLDKMADAQRDNRLLTKAITAYLHLLKMNENLSDTKLVQITSRTLDRIEFRGNYLSAEPVYRLLIRRFPNEVAYRNNLTISFLKANRDDLAKEVLEETLKLWPEDRVALAHYGFVLKNQQNKQYEEAVKYFEKALEGDKGPACEPRFYYHYGDALILLGRYKEAHEVHKRGAKHGHFLSPAQRSLYNIERLKSRPWWRVEDTPYVKLARALENNWKEILKEGEALSAIYEKEKEGLKARGDWTQLDLFAVGREIPNRCKQAPVTCSIVKTEPAAVGCRRGQIKFSSMEPGTWVRPHVGPTNCRLRMHLALSNTKDTFIRVDQETRQWELGKVLLFDDSFEHEVWHNGTAKRLVLIVDVWHPDVTPQERRTLYAI